MRDREILHLPRWISVNLGEMSRWFSSTHDGIIDASLNNISRLRRENSVA